MTARSSSGTSPRSRNSCPSSGCAAVHPTCCSPRTVVYSWGPPHFHRVRRGSCSTSAPSFAAIEAPAREQNQGQPRPRARVSKPRQALRPACTTSPISSTRSRPASCRLRKPVSVGFGQLAAGRMAREAPGHTLQPTALVEMTWMRLFGPNHEEFGATARTSSAPPPRPCAGSWWNTPQTQPEARERRRTVGRTGRSRARVHRAPRGTSGGP